MLFSSKVEQEKNSRVIPYRERWPMPESHVHEHVPLTGVRKEHFLPLRKRLGELQFF